MRVPIHTCRLTAASNCKTQVAIGPILLASLLVPSRPREAAAMVPQILDEATKARAKSIQLKGMDFASELSCQLLKHGSEMESFYSILKAAIEKPSPDRDEIKKLVKAIKVKRNWFEKAEVRYCKTSMFDPVKLFQALVESKQVIVSNTVCLKVCRRVEKYGSKFKL